MSTSCKHAKLRTPSAAWAAGVAASLALALVAMAPAGATTFKSDYSFTGGADGSAPYRQLAADKNGMLYGATDTGGTGGGGTVFRFDPTSGTLTTLYSFTTLGAQGSGPASGVLVDGKGMIYGSTETGGTGTCDLGCGTVFKLNPSTGQLTTLVDFQTAAQGARPEGLALVGGQLYGVTIYGGYSPGGANPGSGTLFRVNPKTKAFTSLHDFNEPGVNDGANPAAALVAGSDGRLYGVASSAGPNGSGTLFAMDPVTAAVSVIHAFDYSVDGAGPRGKLLVLKNELLGTTIAGGPTNAGDGVVFSVDPGTGILTNLYSFAGGADGQNTQAGVVRGSKGRVFGATSQGGSAGAGTLFSVKVTTHAHVVVHDFAISDGSSPSGELLLQGRKYYGVTSGGNGTIYELAP